MIAPSQRAYTVSGNGLREGIGVRQHIDHPQVIRLGEGRKFRAYVPLSESNPPVVIDNQLMEGRLIEIEPDPTTGRLGKMVVSSLDDDCMGIALVRFNAFATGSAGRQVHLDSRASYVAGFRPDVVRRVYKRPSEPTGRFSRRVYFSHHDVLHQLIPGQALFEEQHALRAGEKEPRAVVNRDGRLVVMSSHELHQLIVRARQGRHALRRRSQADRLYSETAHLPESVRAEVLLRGPLLRN